MDTELVPDKEASVRFLQARGILHAVRYCDNGHAMVMSLMLSLIILFQVLIVMADVCVCNEICLYL